MGRVVRAVGVSGVGGVLCVLALMKVYSFDSYDSTLSAGPASGMSKDLVFKGTSTTRMTVGKICQDLFVGN